MGGRYAYFFFELYVRQALIHTFYRDNLIVLFSGIIQRLMLNTIIWALVIDAMFCPKIDIIVIIYSLFFLSVGD